MLSSLAALKLNSQDIYSDEKTEPARSIEVSYTDNKIINIIDTI